MLQDKRMGIVEHLADLRRAIIWGIIAAVAGFVVAYINVNRMIDLMLVPAPFEVLSILGPTEGFLTTLKIALYAGLVIASPAIAACIAWFVAPGLTRAERTWIPIIILCSVILFVIGVILSYKIVLPTVLNFFDMITPDNVEPGVSFALYLTFVMSFLMVFGVGLQFPFVVTLLILTGIVDANSLAKRRWYVIAIIIAVGVVVSYGMEVITMAMFFIPIYLLFELSLIVGRALRKWFIRRKRNNTVRG